MSGIHIMKTWFISESQCISTPSHRTDVALPHMSERNCHNSIHHFSSDMLSHLQSLSNNWLTCVTDWWTKYWIPFYQKKMTNCIFIDGYWVQSNKMAPKALPYVIFLKLKQNFSTDATIFFQLMQYFHKTNVCTHCISHSITLIPTHHVQWHVQLITFQSFLNNRYEFLKTTLIQNDKLMNNSHWILQKFFKITNSREWLPNKSTSLRLASRQRKYNLRTLWYPQDLYD